VVTSLSNALITLIVFSLTIAAALVVAGRAPSAAALVLFPLYCAALVLIAAGFSLGASVLFLRYRDLNQVWDLATQAGFFVAPIVYPLDILPERLHVYLYAWPPTPVIEFTRDVLVRGVVPSLAAHVMLAGVAGVCLGAGTVAFRRLAPRAAEYL
jgi:lipopolysaccharide transport system permease protein